MSMDDVPASSQPASNPRIFFYPTGVPIPVFVEASSIRNRPKLIRSLRNSGALICHGPAEAHIILVDSTTDPGIQFIRDWGTDPAKFVLESSWARKCIEAGRVLLQNDNWGDSVARDDGRSISGTHDGEELNANPLPTPRPTPSDAGPSSTKRDRSHSIHPNLEPESRANSREDVQFKHLEPSSSRSASQGQKNLQTQANPQFQQPPPSQQQSQSQQFSYLAPQSQQLPYSQPAPQPQQFQPQIYPPQYSQPQQSQSNSFSSNQFSNPFAALQMPQFPQTQQGQAMAYPPQMTQNYMGQPNGQPNGPYDAQMFLATLMDVARQQGFQMPLGVPQQMPNNMLQHMVQFQNNGMPPSGQGQSISSSFPNSLVTRDTPDGSSHLPTSAAPQSSSPEMCAPSIRRRSPLPSTPSPPLPPSRRKGKEKALAPRQNSFKRKRSESSEEEEEEEEPFTTPPRHRQTNDPQVLSPRKLGEIFRSDSGESLLFFVQVDLMGRHGVVQNIKKNGGKMGGSINDADYVILGNTLSKTFPDLLAQTTAVNKLPLRSAFIVDCVKHAALLDVDNYVLEEYIPPKKRGRPSVVTMKAEKPKEKIQKKEPRKTTPKKKAVQPVEQIRCDGPPSPTPPPLSTRIELSGGHFRFSDEEVNFFKRYARHLVEMDHLISNTAIFKRLYEKMPHHSPPSWGAYIRRVCPDELDTIRKKVGIARRKTADAGNNSQANGSGQVQNEAGPSKRSSPAIHDSMSGIEAQDPQQQDFRDICQFFATGGGEDSDDEVVWASLASHQPCRSAASWPEYYQSQVDAITKEIERLIEEAAADEAGCAHNREA
ncbi:hypothetical protein PILCRDRAFT_827355 [Piloderma croceum F 1598]|uniref:BRCT domain-containing protein n=1 Tax=Piloderma croceum (strain F 1598) TaxID=765440 RepID=A0A0C3BDQ1_PILCF|nr:hypothetical protein PILCRDRAFT_827355 [Piloderma croceum F 1598]